MGLGFGRSLPSQWWDWTLARETGWTLEYIRNMSVKDFHEYIQIRDAESRVRQLK
jgi:hypothetical protein